MRKPRTLVTGVVLAFAAMMVPRGGLEPAFATVEPPTDAAVVRMINATETAVDIYVNHAPSPTITDVKPLSIGPEFEVKDSSDRPYGTYTFSARPKGDPAAPVIASASVAASEGRYFSAVLQPTPSGVAQIAVYEEPFTPTGAALLTVRHNAALGPVTWRIHPKDPGNGIPADTREGTLGNGQWQAAIDVTPNDYVLEFLSGGQVVARHPDVELEHEKNRVLTLVGWPVATDDPNVLRRHLLEEEYQVPLGPSLPDEVTAPSGPLTTTDDNAPLVFSCPAVEVWQANAATAQVGVVDPDGVVGSLAVDAIVPQTGGIGIRDVLVAGAVGESATATIEVKSDVPAGEYAVTVIANRGTFGHQAGCVVSVTVKAITIGRLRDQVNTHTAAGDIQSGTAGVLHEHLDAAEQQLAAGQQAQGCETLKTLTATLGSEKGKTISAQVAEQLEREANALRATLGCG
jgi:hypothetical protein